MAENLSLNVNVNTSGAEASVGSLKKQLREAQAEVATLAEKFGVTSIEAINAAKKAGELRDKIGDAKAMADAFNPDAKFKALTASLSGVAGGFGAVQGAMALFGAESENVQKTLLKVQSAMAISQGLQSLGESVDSFRNLGAVIKSSTIFQQAYNFVLGQKVVITEADIVATEAQTIATAEQGAVTVATTTAVEGATFAMKAFRVALIASGIGLLVAAIGLAVQAFSNYVNAADKAKAAQDGLNKKVAEGAKIQLEGEMNFLANQEKLDVARAKSKGASEQEIFDIEQSYRKQRAESHQRHYEEVYGKDSKAAEESSNEINKINLDGQIANLENQGRIRKEALERKKEEEVAAALKEKKAIDDALAAYEKRKKPKTEILTVSDIDEQAKKDKAEKDKEEADAAQELIIESNKNGIGKLLEVKKTGLAADLEVLQQKANDDKLIEETRLQTKAQMQETEISLAEQTGNLLGQIAGKSKGVAIAGLLIEKGASIAKIIAGMNSIPLFLAPTLPNPAYIPSRISGALSIASVIAAASSGIQQINSAASGGGSSGGGGMPSVAGAAPIAPQVPTAQVTQLNQQSINDIGNQSVRAYVVESDVSNNQQRIAAIRQRARFS